MKVEDLAKVALGSQVLDKEIVDEVLGYGISEFLKAGCTYEQAVDIIENAQINSERIKYQSQLTRNRDED